jgi:hypothetical protein
MHLIGYLYEECDVVCVNISNKSRCQVAIAYFVLLLNKGV